MNTATHKILIVEDDQYIREMYALILKRHGYEVQEAPDGAVGLSYAQEGGWDVILLDLMMPNMDGLTFLKHLQDETPPKRPNGPTIVLSNLAYSDAKDEAVKLGAKGFLVKADLEPKEILEAVQKALSDKT